MKIVQVRRRADIFEEAAQWRDRDVSVLPVGDHIADVNKMVQVDIGSTPAELFLRSTQEEHARHLYSVDIRPLAVSPLAHHESEPTPWGFFMSGRRHP